MKMFALAAGLAALVTVGTAQAAPLSAQPGLTTPDSPMVQVRDRDRGHGGMSGMQNGNMRGMKHGGMRGMRQGRGMSGMRHGGRMGNMRGMNHGGM